jgi:hypothetical protein
VNIKKHSIKLADQRESFWAGCGLFEYVQILSFLMVVTKYSAIRMQSNIKENFGRTEVSSQRKQVTLTNSLLVGRCSKTPITDYRALLKHFMLNIRSQLLTSIVSLLLITAFAMRTLSNSRTEKNLGPLIIQTITRLIAN